MGKIKNYSDSGSSGSWQLLYAGHAMVAATCNPYYITKVLESTSFQINIRGMPSSPTTTATATATATATNSILK